MSDRLGWSIGMEFKKQDLWVGVFWKVEQVSIGWKLGRQTTWWICLLPMLPIVIRRTALTGEADDVGA